VDATAVQVAETGTGMTSLTVAPDTLDGPPFVTTIVYVVCVPATTSSTPSVFVIERPAVGLSVSESVALLSLASGSVIPLGAATVTVFTSVPVALGPMFATKVKVTVPPGCTVTVVSMSPVPEEATTLEPADASAVQAEEVTSAGMASCTAAPRAVEGPSFPTTIV
jgi:hypothetical protein